MSALAPAVALLDPTTVHREVLPNGLTVLVREDHSAPVVAVNTYVKAGYFDETDNVAGIAHVLEHMFFKGTTRRGVGEIAKETKASGGYLNAHTIYDHTSYYAVLPSSGFAAGLDVQADAYAHSVIDAGELARELEVIIQEAKRKLDNPSAVTSETLYALLHDRHRIRRWRIGTEAGLRQLTRDDLVRFYRNFYRPRNTVLSIVGDIDAGPTFDQVRALYGDIPDAPIERHPGEVETEQPGVRYREIEGDVQQVEVSIGWRTPDRDHSDTPHLDLAAAILGVGRGSRLYRGVRERQLVTSIGAYNFTPTELGVFSVHFEARPEHATAALRAVWAEVMALRANAVRSAELERVRRIIESRWLRRLETMEGQASYLAEWEAAGGWELGERYVEHLLAATPADVNAVIDRHLVTTDVGAVVYRPTMMTPIAADVEAFRAIIESSDDAELTARADVPPLTSGGAPAVSGSVPVAERVEAGVHVFRTAGGVPVLVRPKPGAAITHMGVYIVGGAVEERDDSAGLTALMAQTSTKGTERRTAGQIAEHGELLGGSVSASVGLESFGWTISVPRRNLAAAAELLADVVQCPVFPADAFDTERRVALANVIAARDDMFRYPMRLAAAAAYAGHPYGRPVDGDAGSLSRLTADTAAAWHAEQVLHSASVIAIVGDVEPSEVAALVGGAFTRLQTRSAVAIAAPVWPLEVTTAVESRDKAQTALTLLFPGPARDDDARVAAQLLASIASGLGGRFFDELRDRRSLAYTVQAFASIRRRSGAFGAYIATSPAREDDAREGLLAEFARLVDAGVTIDELERARTYALGTHAIQRQSGGAVVGEIVDAWQFGAGLAELDDYEARIRSVDLAAVHALAEQFFDPSRRVEGIVRGR